MLNSGIRALKAGHWPSLIGAWLHFEVSFMVWLLIGALGVAISEEFSLSPTAKGFLVATPLLGGALLRIVVGPLADHFGPKKIGLGILGCEVLALFLGWTAGTSYLFLVGIGFLLGFAGASFAIALPIASQAYPPEHQGLAMGVAAIGNSGVLLATFFAPRLADLFGWHATFGLMMIPVFFTGIIFAWLVPTRPPGNLPRKPSSVKSYLTLWGRQPLLGWLCFFYGVTFGGFVGFSSFLPIFFHEQHSMDMVTAGTMTAFCGLAGSLARPFGGHAADRWGGVTLLQGLFVLIAICCVLLGGLTDSGFALSLIPGMMLLLGFGNGVVFQLVSLRFRHMMGTASGFIGAAGGLGGFLLPSWFGLLKDSTGSYLSGFFVFALLAIIAAFSILVVRRTVNSYVPERTQGGSLL